MEKYARRILRGSEYGVSCALVMIQLLVGDGVKDIVLLVEGNGDST